MILGLEIVVLMVGAVAMYKLLPRERVRYEPERVRAQSRAEDLARIELIVPSGHASAAEVHLRLRPLLRQIAVSRLSERGIALDRDEAQARAALGEELWEIVRPGRPRPQEPRAQVLSLAQLTAMTERLERL